MIFVLIISIYGLVHLGCCCKPNRQYFNTQTTKIVSKPKKMTRISQSMMLNHKIKSFDLKRILFYQDSFL